ncbi:MAG: protein translocase subunit SecD [Candidatus Niyogibacteria bacterium]|nr:protein translocase subunit SecD [Candidatus Niyogibacteria bacterium]
MAKTRFLAIILFLIGALAGYFDAAPFLAPESFLARFPFRLGLDLSGGAQLVYQADVSLLAASEIKESMEGLRDVIERRVNHLGVAEPIVQVEKHGEERRLIVELAGISDVNQAIKMIGATPYLEFRVERPAAERDAILEKQKTDNSLSEDPYFIPSILTGRYLKRAALDFNQTTFEPVVNLEFNSEGENIFSNLTRENIGKRLAIYIDGTPLSAPTVREEIIGGRAQISGKFTPEQAKTLVKDLNAGALPIPIKLISQQNIGASLGSDALARGIRAGLYGAMAIAVFLILWYRIPGLVAILALLIYISLVLALFKLIPVTLTAAGIAGFILSMGVAVDANILIFERFKEETRSGKNIAFALEDGFKRGWTSIRDSNISSFITAMILYWFSTSLVRGFALTLGLGILVSLFSALIITKIFIFALGVRQVNRISSFLFGAGFRNIS